MKTLPHKVMAADPPWDFKTYSDKGQGKSAPYPTLNYKDMLDLPVADIMARDSLLFMWATGPNLAQALELGTAWGYTYVTIAFTWVKQSSRGHGWHWGMGYYTRANAELVLLFKRGSGLSRKRRDVHQLILDDDALVLFTESEVIMNRVMAHSRKPEDVQDRIEQLFDGPYVELFARRQRSGWLCLGNEIDGLDIRDSLKQVMSRAGDGE